jgi:hypothetical protein
MRKVFMYHLCHRFYIGSYMKIPEYFRTQVFLMLVGRQV